jgi:leader peptidase (prepilin peptidase)/N-methyltransferase
VLVTVTAALTGSTAAIVGATLPSMFASLPFWLLAVGAVGMAIIDMRCRRLPHHLTGALWAACALCFAITAIVSQELEPLVRAVCAGSATAAALLTVALAMPGQLGLGDVTFAGALTFSLGWLGWHSALLGLLAGLLLQSAVAVLTRLRRVDVRTTPMGPALMTGWLLAVVMAGL